MDSHVLLHLCAALRDTGTPFEFHAIHVHHGLQREADAWSEHCAAICQAHAIPLLNLKVDARAKPGESQEDAARTARYAAIAAHLAAGDLLLTAQHRDDQAETLLLQLLRGAGLAGLAAMPAWAPLGPGSLARPLLEHSRAELLAYAHAQKLAWIEDPSNQNERYDRNFLRRRILPVLQQRWPSCAKTLSRSARHCAEASQRLDELAQDLYQSTLRADGQSLSIAKLQAFHRADQKLVLRHWLKASGLRMASAALMDRILHEALPAAPGKNPVIAWREGEVRRYRDGLHLLAPLPAFDASLDLPWDGAAPLTLPDGNGVLSASLVDGMGLNPLIWSTADIRIRYRQGGERCRLPRRAGSHELKKLFQEAGIAPWLRERAPLVYLNGELAAVAGWWVCQSCAGEADARNIALAWHPFTPPLAG
jgi:tRNA(Ile)-lysidine synthase